MGGLAGSVPSQLQSRGHIPVLKGKCVEQNIGLLASAFHEEVAGWAWGLRLLISCYSKLQSQILVGRNLVEQVTIASPPVFLSGLGAT